MLKRLAILMLASACTTFSGPLIDQESAQDRLEDSFEYRGAVSEVTEQAEIEVCTTFLGLTSDSSVRVQHFEFTLAPHSGAPRRMRACVEHRSNGITSWQYFPV